MLRFPALYAHNTFSFNSHLDAAGASDETAVHSTVTIDERSINTMYRDARDPYHLTQGGTLGRIHKNFTTIQIGGRIQAPDATQPGSLGDREREMMAAFDPALCLRDSPTTNGAYQLTFTENTASGTQALQYWCRPGDRPRVSENIGDGGWRRYALALIAPDPRAYAQTETTLALTIGAPSGNVVNSGTVPAPIKVTIVTSGAGSASFSLTRAGVTFVIDLSGAAGTYVIVMETCAPYGTGRSITKSGVSVFSLKTSDASTWLDAPVGTTSFAIANTANVTSCTIATYSAWA